MQYGRNISTFQRNNLQSSSLAMGMPSLSYASVFYYSLHSVTYQKTAFAEMLSGDVENDFCCVMFHISKNL
jgi:hypothetical protein